MLRCNGSSLVNMRSVPQPKCHVRSPILACFLLGFSFLPEKLAKNVFIQLVFAFAVFQIKYAKGDLFSCPSTDSLAHCISEDCRMGAGIAVLFKKKFGGVEELLDQQKKSGEVAVLKRDDRYIYYLITKKKVSHKPTYENMRKSLDAMKTHCLNNGVTDISMPRIGCGLDRLEWSKVSAILGEVFEDTDIKITVYTL
ncbi:PREDICTED: O-acetyl-ADP-ribose deacetylase 1 isoform X1 [Gavialis gangeticus]|uniref:O-acetyl-ADP-ribose deacetylase 1 isoform X1 n=1 Tax=Gavialis gangeticus TaxID=94835 RepID=UPI00092EB5CB|nr:PREDICTED: O-acetyl-ADP-ribose deacetylase 1 isoform X1 [Gavialis gangeticus]